MKGPLMCAVLVAVVCYPKWFRFFTNFVRDILDNSACREYVVKIRYACYGQYIPFCIPSLVYI